jgi:hypothetical protein
LRRSGNQPPDAKKGSEGELPFSVCIAIEGDDRLGVSEECGHGRTVPKKMSAIDFFSPRSIFASPARGKRRELNEAVEPAAVQRQ